MQIQPIAMGRAREELYAIPSGGENIVPENMKSIKTGLEDTLLVSKPVSDHIQGQHDKVTVIPDGNRGAILPDVIVEFWDRSFIVGLKGIGARTSMFENGHMDFKGLPISHEPQFTSESWFGENPWGAMSHQACMEDAQVTELTTSQGINGFHICPMIRATPLPKWLMKEAKSRFWYRRLDRPGPYYQQMRLMPSDVRLFYQSEATLGRKTKGVLEAFEIISNEDLDSFINNYIRSGIAALTLIARTLRAHELWGHSALGYSDVWLDKDSVISSDGTIYFADIEGLEWIPIRDETEAIFRMKRQFNRNYYEFIYGLDSLLKERQILHGLPIPRRELREETAARFELALEDDPYVELKKTNESLFVCQNPSEMKNAEVSINILDFK